MPAIVLTTSTSLTNPTTQSPDSTILLLTTGSISRPPESQFTVDTSSHMALPSSDLPSHLVFQTPSNADISSYLVLPTLSNVDLPTFLPTPSNVDLPSHLVLPTLSTVDLSSHLVLSNAAFSGSNSITPSSPPHQDNFSRIHARVIWGVGTGVGGAVILLLLCTGVFSCVLYTKKCKCTRHTADIDDSVPGGRWKILKVNEIVRV